jgi:hypothetical protein
MSNNLAISAALSVLLMSGYVLLGHETARVGPGAEIHHGLKMEASASQTSLLNSLLPKLR